MLKGVFYTALGVGVGAVAGVYVVRKLEQTQRALTAENASSWAGAQAGALIERAQAALAAGRRAATAREAELRADYQPRTEAGAAMLGSETADTQDVGRAGRGAASRPAGGSDPPGASNGGQASAAPSGSGRSGTASPGSEQADVAPSGGRRAQWQSRDRAAPSAHDPDAVPPWPPAR